MSTGGRSDRDRVNGTPGDGAPESVGAVGAVDAGGAGAVAPGVVAGGSFVGVEKRASAMVRGGAAGAGAGTTGAGGGTRFGTNSSSCTRSAGDALAAFGP